MTDELRDELDRLAAGAPSPDERRDQVMRAARRRSRVGMVVAGVIAVTGVLVGVLAVGAVLDRRKTRPVGPTPTGVVRVSVAASTPPPTEARGENSPTSETVRSAVPRSSVVRNPDGSDPRTIGDLSISTSRLSIAPDGSIAGGLRPRAGRRNRAARGDRPVDGGGAHDLRRGPAERPRLVARWIDDRLLHRLRSALHDPVRRRHATPVRDEGDGRFLKGYEASWSPDGDSLVALDDAGEVFVVEVDGTSPVRRLTSMGAQAGRTGAPTGSWSRPWCTASGRSTCSTPENGASPQLLLDRPETKPPRRSPRRQVPRVRGQRRGPARPVRDGCRIRRGRSADRRCGPRALAGVDPLVLTP